MTTTTAPAYEKTALLPVDADTAFALLTEPARLRRWQAVSARIDLRAGGAYRWTVVPGHVAAGTVREVEPGRRLVLGWGWEGSPDLAPDASTVTVTFEPADGGTLVRIRHEGLDEAQAAGHAEGWEHFTERLVAAATHGDAGPDSWAHAPADLTPLTSADATLAVLQHVLRGLTSDVKHAATPCTEFDVHAVVEHLVTSMINLGGVAGASIERGEDRHPETLVAETAQEAVEAWTRRGLEGTVDLGPTTMPASAVAGILSLEFLLHAWDLAQAAGTTVPVSDEVAGYVLTLAEQVIAPGQRGTAFAEAVEPATDAGPMERLVSFSGRRPL